MEPELSVARTWLLFSMVERTSPLPRPGIVRRSASKATGERFTPGRMDAAGGIGEGRVSSLAGFSAFPGSPS